jgi:hypothetical protein
MTVLAKFVQHMFNL